MFKKVYKASISHAHTCLLKNVRFYLIFGAFEEWLFVKLSNSYWMAGSCFSLLTIFAFIVFCTKKTPRKSWFFCVSLLPIWIPLKRQSIFKFFGIPGSLLRPPDVRIWNEITLKSACFWNAQKLLKKSWFYCVLKGPIEYASPGVVLGHAFS